MLIAIRKRGAVVSILLACGVVGCSSAPEQTADGGGEAAYRQAVETARSCMEEQGYEASDVVKTEGGQYQFSVTVPEGISAEEDAELTARYNECLDEARVDELAAAVEGVHLTGAERDQAMAELIDCLGDYGVTGLDPAETDSRVFAREVFAVGDDADEAQALICMDRYRAVWPPGDANNP